MNPGHCRLVLKENSKGNFSFQIWCGSMAMLNLFGIQGWWGPSKRNHKLDVKHVENHLQLDATGRAQELQVLDLLQQCFSRAPSILHIFFKELLIKTCKPEALCLLGHHVVSSHLLLWSVNSEIYSPSLVRLLAFLAMLQGNFFLSV